MSRSIDPIRRQARRDATAAPHPALIVPMSLRPGIPRRGALQHCPLALPRLSSDFYKTVVKASLLQRTATCPFFPGLTKPPHSKVCPNSLARGPQTALRHVKRGAFKREQAQDHYPFPKGRQACYELSPPRMLTDSERRGRPDSTPKPQPSYLARRHGDYGRDGAAPFGPFKPPPCGLVLQCRSQL
jgi:hypothetical protein